MCVKQDFLEISHSWQPHKICQLRETKFMAADIGLLDDENEPCYSAQALQRDVMTINMVTSLTVSQCQKIQSNKFHISIIDEMS
jgi:hypothetical protein